MDGIRSAQPSSLQLRLGPLIAAARRQARRHAVLLAAAVVAVGGGGVAARILTSGSSHAPTRSIEAALVRSPYVAAGQGHGHPVVQGGIPTILRFVPGATFAIAVVVTNKAGAPITLQRAQAILPPNSPLRQIGTRLLAFKPFVCPTGAMCPLYEPLGPGPYGVSVRPLPLGVAPGSEALAQLHFQFVPCWSKTLRAGATVRRVTIAYRSPDGTVIRQHLRLGDSIPQLTGTPTRPTCTR